MSQFTAIVIVLFGLADGARVDGTRQRKIKEDEGFVLHNTGALQKSRQALSRCSNSSCDGPDAGSLAEISIVPSSSTGVEFEPHTHKRKEVLQFFIVAAKSVGVVFIVASAGAFLVYAKIITQEMRRGFASVAMNVAIPCLYFTSILACPPCREGGLSSPGCKPCVPLITKLVESALLFLSPLIVVAVGLLCGCIVALCFGLGGDLKRLCVACVSFGNSSAMPPVLLPVVFHCLRGRDLLSIEDPLPFLAIYLVLYPTLQYTIGSWLLYVVTNEDEVGNLAKSPNIDASSALSSKDGYYHRSDARPQDACATEEKVGSTNPDARFTFQQILPPPVIAILIAILVGSTPAHGLFVDTTRQGDSVPLHWMFVGLSILGQAAVPLQVIVLGSALADGVTRSSLPLKLNLAIAVSKLIVVPAVMLAIVSFSRQSLLSRFPPSMRNTVCLVILVCGCTPTANALLIIATSGGHDTGRIASTIFLQYVLAPLFITAWLTVFLNTLQ